MHHSFQVFSHKNVNDLTAVQILMTTPETVTSDVTIQNALVRVLDWITSITNACIIHVPRAISMQFVALVSFSERLDVCQPVSDVASRRHLRSAGQRLLNVPQQRRSTFARRAFSVAGPLVWNSLPDYMRDPAFSRDTFCKHLKTFLFAVY